MNIRENLLIRFKLIKSFPFSFDELDNSLDFQIIEIFMRVLRGQY